MVQARRGEYKLALVAADEAVSLYLGRDRRKLDACDFGLWIRLAAARGHAQLRDIELGM